MAILPQALHPGVGGSDRGDGDGSINSDDLQEVSGTQYTPRTEGRLGARKPV